MNLKPFLIACSIFLLTGCQIPLAISSLFAGDGTKSEKLQKSVSTLHAALQYGTPYTASEVVSPELAHTYFSQMIGRSKETKVAEVAIQDIKMDQDDDKKATLIADIKIFGPPYYSVTTVTRKESWEYTVSRGWNLVQIEELPTTDER